MHVFVPLYSAWQLNFHKQLFSHKKGVWYQGGGGGGGAMYPDGNRIQNSFDPAPSVYCNYVCVHE